jgi:spore coat protein A
MHWYHDHADGMTRINAYAGLAGLYIVRDGNEKAMVTANVLPTGEYEVPLVISDRVFDANGQLAYVGDVPAFNGWNADALTVNPPRPVTKLLTNGDATAATPATSFYPIKTDPSTGAPTLDPNTGNPIVDPGTGFYKTVGGSYNPDDPAAIVAGKQPTHVPEFYGEVICVNGKAWPNLKVEQRPYRLRLLNGSDSRFYNLRFELSPGVLLPFYLIATDQGFLNAPVPVPGSTQLIGPGERMDVLIDFSKVPGTTSPLPIGTKIRVLNDAAFPYPGGQGVNVDLDPWGTVMQIEVASAANTLKQPVTALPAKLRNNTADSALLPTAIAFAKKATVTRQILLGEGCDEYGRIMPLLGTVAEGTKAFHDGADIFPKFGTTEIWEFWNTTVDAHPIHMHLVKFRVLNRQIMTATPVAKAMANGWTGVALASPPTLVDSTTGALIPPATSPVDAPPTEQGWKDTVVCPPGQVTRVVATFDKRGTYVYHCHILGHEEHDMMRWFQVI